MAETVVIDFQANTSGLKAANDELVKLLGNSKKLSDSFSKSNQGFNKEVDKTKSNLSDLSGSLNNIAASVGVAFGISQLIEFGKETFKLAIQAEGVGNAFKRLNNPALLDDLRKATKGTVSDLELMKAAVNANNFKIPLEQMGKLLAFANSRARDTGQSVDYLVQSIITGIARKSLPILDNLGLNTKIISDEFQKTGDMAAAVGNIIDKEMGAAGQQILSDGEKVDILNARWENLKVTIGTVFKDITLNSPLVKQFTSADEAQQTLQSGIDKLKSSFISNYKQMTDEQRQSLKLFMEEKMSLYDLEQQLSLGYGNLHNQYQLLLQVNQQLVKEKRHKIIVDNEAAMNEKKYLKMSLEDLKALADGGDEVAKKEIERREKSLKSWQDYQKQIKDRQEEILRQEDDFNKQLLEYDELLQKDRIAAAKDFQSNLINLTEEQLQELLDLQQIPDDLFYETLEKKKEAEGENYEERIDQQRQFAEKQKEITRQLADFEFEVENETFNAARAFSELGAQLFKENAGLQKTFLTFERIVAIAQIIRNLQVEKAGYYLTASELSAITPALAPVYQAAAVAKSQAANIRAGVSVGTIVAQTIPEFKFAEGTKSVGGGIEGKDSVHALVMPGEAIIPTRKARKLQPTLDFIWENQYAPEMLNAFVKETKGGSNIVNVGFDEYKLGRMYGNESGKIVTELKQLRKEISSKNEYKLLQRRGAWA